MSEQHNCDAHLQAAAAEIEALKRTLHEKQQQMAAMESACLRESEHQAELEDSVIAWQDKYERLYESHKRVQKVNQSLEDKLLKLVERNTSERAQLTSDVATLSVRLAQANYNIAKLQREIERYKTDINLAIQLLQCKPESFVPQKVSSLPIEIQSKVSSYMRLETNSHSDSEGSTSGVGVATSGSYKVVPASDSPPAACPFPPTAMVYSMRGLDGTTNDATNNNLHNDHATINSPITKKTFAYTANSVVNSACNNNLVTANGPSAGHEMISPSIAAKFLEEELKISDVKHCDTCQCASKDLTVLLDVSRSYSVSTQTPFSSSFAATASHNEALTALCLRCNSNLNSPSRTNSPYLMKLLKSSDSVISETKSSVSDLNDVDKLFTPAKRDDLMVNPILGHHRLCGRSSGSSALNGHKSACLVNSSSYYASCPSDSATKYILEPSTTATIYLNGNGFPRRIADDGSIALESLDLRKRYDATNPSRRQQEDDANVFEHSTHEAKPLLSGGTQVNLDECEKKGELEDCSTQGTPGARDHGVRGQNGMLQTTTSGSVHSLWSRASSCEGAKMFETFNRNLIKTIKAENPKYPGPRMCAMRIQQNGQGNILLDNIESIEAVAPTIYTRRERFLDEEFDDTEDVVTSKTSVTSRAQLIDTSEDGTNSPQYVGEGLMTKEGEIHVAQRVALDTLDTEDHEKRVVTGSGDGCGVGNCGGGHDKTAVVVEAGTKPAQTDQEEALPPNTMEPSNAVEFTATGKEVEPPPTNNYSDQRHKIHLNSEQQQQLLAVSLNHEVLHQNDASCRNSQKSYTQSSSVSDATEFRESILLRRQQLSRVAEWVQNSQQLQEHHQQAAACAIDSASHRVASSGAADQQSTHSLTDRYVSVSVEKPSVDSVCKTMPQPQTNGFVEHQQKESARAKDERLAVKKSLTNVGNRNKSSTHLRRTGCADLPVAHPVPDAAENLNANTSMPLNRQSSCDVLNYKYYPSDSDRSLAIDAELHTMTQHVDIAQMEYNVKQFLLKQNEWSMRNSRSTACSATAQKYPKRSDAPGKHHQQNIVKPLRQSKLFSGVGCGPGVGERVRVVAAAAGQSAAQASSTEPNQQRPTPQRTETNL